MKTKDIAREELESRISAIERLIMSAKDCLAADDYFQCAVRLDSAGRYGEFSEFQMNIFEDLSEEEE